MKLLDTSSLICFFSELKKPEYLDLIIKRGHELLITNQVKSEIMDKNSKDLLDVFINTKKIKLYNKSLEKEVDELKPRYFYLGKGERSLLALAEQFKDKQAYFVFDDKNARRVAKKCGMKITGTYGLIKYIYQNKLISKDDFCDSLKSLNSSKFRIKLLEDDLNECGIKN